MPESENRIEPLDREHVHPDAIPFYDQDERAYGLVLNTTQVLAYRPSILGGARALSRGVLTDSVTPPELRALIYTRVAMLVGCPF
jgi:hypothetical protein